MKPKPADIPHLIGSSVQVAAALNKKEREAILFLPAEKGHRVVGGLRGHKPDPTQKFRRLGLLDEAWTFLSTTRPDTGLSDFGRRVRQVVLRRG